MTRRNHAVDGLLLLWLSLPAVAPAQELACPQLDESAADVAAPVDDRLVLTADKAELTQNGLSTLAGTVRLMQGGNVFETQALSYDEQAQRVRVQAESVFRNKTLLIRSREAEFDFANETGMFLGTEFTLIERGARGAAGQIRLTRAGEARIEDVYYTTCAPGSRAWFLEASEITLDQEEGLGTARHARLRFGYVPILYAPWFQFPINDDRRSGFLFPTIGESSTTGFDARIPFYWNLAPNYDLQLTPRYMADRGTQLGTEGRYLLRNHTGQVIYEYLDKDEESERLGLANTERSYVDFEHQGLINRRLAVDARYGETSDSAYFEDLSGRLEAASTTHLERSARLTYAAPAAYTVTARVADYQTVSSSVLPAFEPYQRLPEVRVEGMTRKEWLNSRLGFAGEYVNFVRILPPEGQRVDLNPFVKILADHSAWYIGSQWNWRYTEYVVTDPGTGQASRPTRSLPVLNAEAGLRFERLTGAGSLQTLEPRVYYLYVPYENQDDLPVFDSGEPDFDFVQLFEDNRFSGEDRLADANHFATAITTRLLDPADGVARLSASVGQLYRFEAPRVVVVPGDSTPDRGGTDYIAGFDYRFSPEWSVASAGQWSPDTNQIQRSSLALRYRRDSRRLDLSYRYRRDLQFDEFGAPLSVEQADLSGVTPVWGGWSLLGRWRYSLAEERTLESLGGLEYRTCCWALRAAGRRYQYSFDTVAQEANYTTGFYVQLELTGLARIGAGFQALLPTLGDESGDE